MTRALGHKQMKRVGVTAQPSINSRSLTKGDDFILLATDGLWNFVTPQVLNPKP